MNFRDKQATNPFNFLHSIWPFLVRFYFLKCLSLNFMDNSIGFGKLIPIS